MVFNVFQYASIIQKRTYILKYSLCYGIFCICDHRVSSEITEHISYAAHYRFALDTFVMTGVTALTYGFDLHPLWDMKFRWPAYLRHNAR